MRPGVLDFFDGSHLRDFLTVVFVLVTVTATLTNASIMGDECDWTASGLTTSSSVKGVTPVYLRCSSGKIKWVYPRGALRVLLRLPRQDRNFRACLKMRQNGKNDLAARIFLEGPRSLLPLYTTKENSNKAVRCFSSKNGQVAIYVESSDDRAFEKQIVELDYDLQQLPKNSYGYDRGEECRPCTAEELIYTFCTSDLVTRGTIHEVSNDGRQEISQMTVRITKLIRHTNAEEYIKDIEDNEIPNDIYDSKYVILDVPHYCQVTHGVGEFVFMARRKLGDLSLQCAPRLEDWAMIINKFNADNRANCLLKS